MSSSTSILIHAGDLRWDQLKPIILRKFVKALVPLAIINIIAAFIAFSLYGRFLDREEQGQVERALLSGESLIQRDMNHIISSLSYIHSSRAMQNFAEHGFQHAQQDVEYALYNLMDTRGIYDQARLLDKNGQELVRVEQGEDHPIIVEAPYLQDKALRYYFIEGSKLPPDLVYMSPMDLNVENGVIESPVKPMLRFTRSLYDSSGEFQGLIVLNYRGSEVLTQFDQLMRSVPGEGMLVNREGYWFFNDDHSLEWGFVLEHGQSFARQKPEVWSQMENQQYGELREGDTVYTYQSINLFPKQNSALLAEKSVMENQWKIIISRKDHSAINLIFETLSHSYPLLIIYPILLLLIWSWARASSAHELAEKNILELNRTLENKVKRRTRELQLTKDVTILSMATLAETRDDETGMHIKRTQLYVKRLAEELQKQPKFRPHLTDQTVELICKSAPLHDIGKVGIPDAILLKPDKLTSDEFEIMKQHTTLGVNAFKESINMMQSELPGSHAQEFLLLAKQIIHYHHEKWDGTGYPEGLQGESIPLPARIMAVADVFDALSCQRVYKDAFGREATFKIMEESCGSHFDPEIYRVFEQIRDEFWEIRNELSDEQQA
ncbi:HD domain-containing phosphohydrolase [Vibrio sp. HN007]|uniref:HD domain-containing phosphohydrolase n=1 Tax=Vibrio iocasae TaxID=3098914 RepID=UPI0035D4D410